MQLVQVRFCWTGTLQGALEGKLIILPTLLIQVAQLKTWQPSPMKTSINPAGSGGKIPLLSFGTKVCSPSKVNPIR